MTTQKQDTFTPVVETLLNVSSEQVAFAQRKGEQYATVATYMSQEGMSLTDLAARVATAKGSDWKVVDGDPIGRQKAIADGSKYAIALQRFAVWLGSSVELDGEKVPVVEGDKLKAKAKATRQPGGKASSKTKDKGTMITGDELIALALEEMAKRIEQKRPTAKRKAQKDEIDELISYIDELSDYFNVEVVNA